MYNYVIIEAQYSTLLPQKCFCCFHLKPISFISYACNPHPEDYNFHFMYTSMSSSINSFFTVDILTEDFRMSRFNQ
jgi:hypothetical protein